MKAIDVLKVARGALDSQAMTTGAAGIAPDRFRGFSTVVSPGLGALVDDTSNIYAGTVIRELYWFEGSGGSDAVVFQVAGVVANAGWTSLISSHAGETLNRAAAAFSTVGGKTTWTWATAYTAGNNPFTGNPNIIWI